MSPLTEGPNFQEQFNQHKKRVKENQDDYKEMEPGAVEGHLHATAPTTEDKTGIHQYSLRL